MHFRRRFFSKVHAHYRHELVFFWRFSRPRGGCALCNPKYGIHDWLLKKKWYSQLTFGEKKWHSWLILKKRNNIHDWLFNKNIMFTIDFWKKNDIHDWLLKKKKIFTEPKGRSEYNFCFKCQLIHTFQNQDSNCFIFYFEIKKNVFNASDLIFTGGKYHMLLFFFRTGNSIRNVLF